MISILASFLELPSNIHPHKSNNYKTSFLSNPNFSNKFALGVRGPQAGLDPNGAALPDLSVDGLALKIHKLNGLSKNLSEHMGVSGFHMRKSLLNADQARVNARGQWKEDAEWAPDIAPKVFSKFRGDTHYWPSKGMAESVFL